MSLFAASTGKYGVKVAQNATRLTADVTDVATTIPTAHDCFADSQNVIIETELITIGTHGMSNTGCTRHVSPTSATAHSGPDGDSYGAAEVRAEDGAEILSKVFGIGEKLTVLRVSANAPVTIGVDLGGTLEYAGGKISYELQEFFHAQTQITFGVETTVKIYAWNANAFPVMVHAAMGA
ncbi:MAG: hypothetical protein WC455_14580 [Dehalococcoidia bacterium]|jgi:hypothetical protein